MSMADNAATASSCDELVALPDEDGAFRRVRVVRGGVDRLVARVVVEEWCVSFTVVPDVLVSSGEQVEGSTDQILGRAPRLPVKVMICAHRHCEPV